MRKSVAGSLLCGLVGLGFGVAPGPASTVLMSAARAQEARAQIVINIGSVVVAEPGAETPLPIQLSASGPIPKDSFIRIRGLPPSAKLSEGHVVAPGSWAVPVSALPSLKVSAPVSGGTTQLSIALVGIDGTVWAQASATFTAIAASAIRVDREAAPTPPQATIATVGPAPSPSPSAADAPVLPSLAPRPIVGASPEKPAMKPDDQERAEKLVVKGDEFLRDGDVAGARLFFRRAADLGHARAAIALAETYDPHELKRLGVQGMQPDATAARRWYQHALQLGATEAPERLRRLGSR
jgi:hypothetical protein